jgi:membrane-bound serine protease (ClpP class)
MLGLGLLSLGAGVVLAQSTRPAVVADVRGIINPVLAEYVGRVIDQAEQRNAAAVVLQLDTPGGLDGSMRQIIQRILASRVPVIVYVAPAGARAGSAGVYITYSAHVAAMAPNTNIGSATPVMMGEGGESKVSPEMRAKINNDAVAYIKSLAEQRGRNVEWAERAVVEGVNVPASEAAQLRVVDFVAADLREVLAKSHGRTVETASGPLVLEIAEAPLETVEMTAVERFLHVISDPTIAYILLSLGSLGLMLELYNPGQFLPGIVGVLCLLLAFYALGTLPVNYAALLLIGFGFLLFIADVLSPTHGILTTGGVISFVLGSLMLFNSADGAPFLQVSLAAIATMTAILLGFFVLVVGAVARSRRRKVTTGREGMVGEIAEVRTRLDPTGFVHVESELWRARTVGRPVEPGEQVRVVGLDGLLAMVEPLLAEPPALPSPPPRPQTVSEPGLAVTTKAAPRVDQAEAAPEPSSSPQPPAAPASRL